MFIKRIDFGCIYVCMLWSKVYFADILCLIIITAGIERVVASYPGNDFMSFWAGNTIYSCAAIYISGFS